MNKKIMRALGFTAEVDAVNQGKCPLCKEVVNIIDFRDDASIKEYHISGMCQGCQDKVFTEDVTQPMACGSCGATNPMQCDCAINREDDTYDNPDE